MELESHVDGWYVWLGAFLASVLLVGVAVSFPTAPPPDADRAANVVDEVTTSSYNASGSYEHGAEEVKISTKNIALRGEGGTDRASIRFGTITPVQEHPRNPHPGLDVLWGEPVDEVFNSPEEFEAWAQEARSAAEQSGGEWRHSDGELRVKRVQWGDVNVTLVAG